MEFCHLRNGGPIAIKPLINAVQDFFQFAMTMTHHSNVEKSVEVLDNTAIRRELFKLNY